MTFCPLASVPSYTVTVASNELLQTGNDVHPRQAGPDVAMEHENVLLVT